MSFVTAAPLSSATPLGLKWGLVHAGAQTICICAGLLAVIAIKLIGANVPGAAPTLKTAAYAIGLGAELIYAFALALLRGLIIREVVPTLSLRLWILVGVGYVMAFHLLTGMSSGTLAATQAMQQLSGSMIVSGIAMGAVAGAMIGLLIGAIEALVLRRAATGSGTWIIWSAAAWSAGVVTVFSVAGLLMVVALSAPLAAGIGATAKIATGIVIAALTLPALKRLKPR